MNKQQAAIVRSANLLQRHSLSILPVVAFVCGLFSTSVSQAQINAYFDPNGTNNAGLGGTGSWTASATNWTTNSVNTTGSSGGPTGGGLFSVSTGAATGTAPANSGAYTFNFGGSNGTITQGGGYLAYGVNFTTPGYIWSIDGTGTNSRTLTLTNGVNLGANSLTFSNGPRGLNSFTFSSAVGITGLSGASLTLRNVIPDSASNSFGLYLSGGAISSNIAIDVDIGTGSKLFFGSQNSSGMTNFARIALNTNASGVALNITNSSSGIVSMNGVISGSSGLVLDNTSSGRIQLAAVNTYLGGTTLNNSGTGYISISNAAAFGRGLITSAGAITNFVRAEVDALDITNNWQINSGSTLKLHSNITNITASGVIDGPGSMLFDNNNGNYFLTATNSPFGGGVTVRRGTLYAKKIGNAGSISSIGTNRNITLSSPGSSTTATLRWNGSTNDISDKTITIAGATGSGTILANGAANASLTLNGNLIFAAGGPKVLTLAGYNTNTLVVNSPITDGSNGVIYSGASYTSGSGYRYSIATNTGLVTNCAISGPGIPPNTLITNFSTTAITLNNSLSNATTSTLITNGTVWTVSAGAATNTTPTTNAVTLSADALAPNQISSVSTAGITVNSTMTGPGIPASTTVSAISGNIISLSAALTNLTAVTANTTSFTNSTATNNATSLLLGVSSTGTIVLSNLTSSFSGGVRITNNTDGQSTFVSVPKIGNKGENSPLGTADTINFGSISSKAFPVLRYTGTGETNDKVINLLGTTGIAVLDQSGAGNLKFTGGLTAAIGTNARTIQLQGGTNGTGEIPFNLENITTNSILNVVKAGTGTWTLSGTNSFTGSIEIQGGTLRLISPEAVPAFANLEGAGSNQQIYTFDMVGSSTNYIMNRSRAGVMCFKSDNGPSTITFTNQILGSEMGGSSTKNMTALTNVTVVFAGPYNINYNAANTNVSRSLILGGDGVFKFEGSISGSTIGTNQLIKSNNGIVYLNAANDYNGGTLVVGGSLVVNHANALPSGGAVTVSSNAILRVTAVVDNTISNPIANSGTVQIASGGSMLASQITGGAVELSGSSSQAQLSVTTDPVFSSLIMTGNGNISLSSTGFSVPNSAFSGTNNTLTLTDVPIISSSIVTSVDGLTFADTNSIVAVIDGTPLTLNAINPTLIAGKNYWFESAPTALRIVVSDVGASQLSYNYSATSSIWSTNGTLNWLNSEGSPVGFSNGDSVTFAGGNTADLTVQGTVRPNLLTFTNSSTGVLTLSEGTIETQILNVKGQGTVNLNSQIAQFDGTLGINISSGTLNLNSGAELRASDVTVTGGVLAGSASLNADSYNLTGGEVSVSLKGSGALNLGGTVTISGFNDQFTGPITISGPSVSIAYADSLGGGVISLSGGAVLSVKNGWSLGNTISMGAGGGEVSVLGSASSSANLIGDITNSAGTNTLTKSGVGKLSLTGLLGTTSSHVGLINAAGNLVLSGSEKSIANFSNAGVLTLDGVQVNTKGGWLSGSGSITVTNSVTLSNLGTNFSCSNVVNIAPGGVFNVANSIFTSSSVYTNGVNGSEGKLVALAGGTNRLSGISTVGTIEIQEGASLRIENGTISNTTVTNHGRLIFANASKITNVLGGTNGNTAANGDMTGSGVIAIAGSKWVALGGHIDGGLKLSLEDPNNTYLELLNSNNFTGGIVFATNNSRLRMSNSCALGSGLIDAASSTNAQVEVLVTNEPVSWTIGNEVSTGTSSNSVMNFCPGSNNTLTLTGLIRGSGWLKVGSSAGGYLHVVNDFNDYRAGTEIGYGGIEVSDSVALGRGPINFSTESNSVLKITGTTTFEPSQRMTIGAVKDLTNAAIFDVATGVTATVDSIIEVNTNYTNHPNQVVSVRKIGSGNLVLSATNTYKGTTSVEGGQLSIQTPYLSSSNNVSLTNNSTLNLGFNGTNTIAKLFIDGTQQYQGTWGSLTSSANNKTNLITGSGLLRVTEGSLIPVTVTLPSAELAQLYNGDPKSVTPTATDPNASFIVTYNGSSTRPTAAGTYSVVATVNAPYIGSASGSLTINQGLSSFGDPAIATFTYTNGVGQGSVVSSKTGSSGAVTHFYEGVTPTIYASQTNKPTNAGTYKVTASVPADANYAGHTATFDFTIQKASHTINFDPILKRYGMAPFTIAVDTGASTGSLTYTSSNTGVATVSSVGEVTIVGAGTTSIGIQQAADDNYQAAPKVEKTMTVQKNNQSIIFGTLPNKVFGVSQFDLTATASSGLEVSYASSDTTVATVSGSTVTILKAGSTIITASQAGGDNYNPAPAVEQTLTVDRADQTITFGSLLSKTTGDASFALEAIASSGLVVAYESSNTAVATVSGNTVTIVGAGTTVITASQGGNTNYNAAPAVEQTLTVDPATPTTPTGSTFTNAFGSLNPTNVGADGLAYLMKYALGGTNTNDKVSLPTVALNGSNLTLTAVVRTNDTNVQIVGQWITGLGGTWSNVPMMYGTASANTNNVPNGCQRRDFSVPKDANSRLFLRLQARQTP